MAIYTHNRAAEILDLFEDLLNRHGIKVPSEEDDERGEDNDAALYGMEYWNLLADVENILIGIAQSASVGAEIKPYDFCDEEEQTEWDDGDDRDYYSPACPWNAPGMSASDFVRGLR